MKYLILATSFLASLSSCEHGQGSGQGGHQEVQGKEIGHFKSEKVSKSASIDLNGSVEDVFPLFDPIGEQNWAPSFQPNFIYPLDSTVQEGMSFRTHGHGDADEFLWIITKYDEESHVIQYLVSTPNRYWTITVDCKRTEQDLTMAKITYAYFGLNDTGLKINRLALEKMYKDDLSSWEEAINTFLEG